MRASAIQKNDNNNRQSGYLKAGAIGALSGYALKYILPVTPQEKDEQFSYFLDDARNKAKAAKTAEIDAIRQIEPRTLAVDEFLKLGTEKEINVVDFKKFKEPLRSQILELITRVNDKARDAKLLGKEVYIAFTKHIRPAGTFIALGAVVGLASAFVGGALSRMSEKTVGKQAA